MAERLKPPIKDPETYRAYLKETAVYAFVDRLKMHVLAGERNYLQSEVERLLLNINDIENAPFDNNEAERTPF